LWPRAFHATDGVGSRATISRAAELPIPLGGGDIDDTEVEAGAVLEEINTTTDPGWNPNLDHFSIDDNLQIQQRIVLRLHQLMLE
jgi:hypothetical protein